MRTLKPLAASAAVLLILCTTGFTTAQDSSDQALASFAAAVASGLSAAVTAADGPTDTTGATAWQAGDSTPPSSGRDVNVTLSGSGLGVAVKGNDGSNFRLGLGNGQLAVSADVACTLTCHQQYMCRRSCSRSISCVIQCGNQEGVYPAACGCRQTVHSCSQYYSTGLVPLCM